MVEWRERGYVPDSDSEDDVEVESQGSLTLTAPVEKSNIETASFAGPKSFAVVIEAAKTSATTTTNGSDRRLPLTNLKPINDDTSEDELLEGDLPRLQAVKKTSPKAEKGKAEVVDKKQKDDGKKERVGASGEAVVEEILVEDGDVWDVPNSPAVDRKQTAAPNGQGMDHLSSRQTVSEEPHDESTQAILPMVQPRQHGDGNIWDIPSSQNAGDAETLDAPTIVEDGMENFPQVDAEDGFASDTQVAARPDSQMPGIEPQRINRAVDLRDPRLLLPSSSPYIGPVDLEHAPSQIRELSPIRNRVRSLSDSSSSLSSISSAQFDAVDVAQFSSSPVKAVPAKDKPRPQPDNNALAIDADERLALLAARTGRSFRQRKAMQLLPYTMEQRAYMQRMNERGLQAERLPRSHSPKKPQNQTEESQEANDSFQPSSPVQLEPESALDLGPVQGWRPPPSSPPVAQSPNAAAPKPRKLLQRTKSSSRPRAYVATSVDSLFDEDGELPDLQTLLRGNHTKLDRHVGKKRRTVEVDHEKKVQPLKSTQRNFEIQIPTAKETSILNGYWSDDENMVDAPPSPPQSGSPTSIVHVSLPNALRIREVSTPTKLPTPLTSSIRKPSRTNALDLSDLSDVEPSARKRGAGAIESDVDSEPEDIEEDLTRYTRKTKGVLPASWLKLDLQKQAEKVERAKQRQQRALHSPSKTQDAKGVARRIEKRTRHGQPLSTYQRPIWIDEDESEPEAESVQPPAVSRRYPELFDESLMDVGDDVIEDNGFDLMLPSTSRPRQRKTKDRKRQTRIDDSISFNPTRQTSARSSDIVSLPSTKGRHSKHKSAPSAPRRKRKAQPKLSILDAPDLTGQPRSQQPRFLRIAARQANARKDKARQSPSRKVIRLATATDTQDVMTVLDDWRAGRTSRQRAASSAGPRNTPSEKANARPVQRRSESSGNLSSSRLPLTRPTGNHQSSGASFRQQRLQMPSLDDGDEGLPAPSTSDPNARVALQAPPATAPAGRAASVISGSSRQQPQAAEKSSRPGFLSTKVRSNRVPRSAQFEFTENEAGRKGNRAFFRDALSRLDKAHKTQYVPSSLPLDRFLADTRVPAPPDIDAGLKIGESAAPQPLQRATNKARALLSRTRKRIPQRVNEQAAEFRQPPSIILDPETASVTESIVIDIEEPERERPVLKKLRPAGATYPVDFNVRPLQLGTFYHESTFIGSGKLHHALQIGKRDLSVDAGYSLVNFEGQHFRWGVWNEEVSAELTLLFNMVQKSLEVHGGIDSPVSVHTKNLLAVSNYVGSHLSFADAIDRVAFVSKMVFLLQTMIDFIDVQTASTNLGLRTDILQLISYSTVVAYQLRMIAEHPTVRQNEVITTGTILEKNLQLLLKEVVSEQGLGQIRSFAEHNTHHKEREAGIRSDFPFVDILVIVQSIFRDAQGKLQLHPNKLPKSFWDLAGPVLLASQSVSLETTLNVSVLEKVWYAIMTLLPVQEINDEGQLSVGLRHRQSFEGWKVVKVLIERVLQVYAANPEKQGASFNEYCRTLFHRCHCLISDWGWKDCAIIIQSLYDFFANKNQLGNLHGEDAHGSPRYLDDLDKAPDLNVHAGDLCFHILLKIIGKGIRKMAHTQEEKKIKGLVWRLLPNHGRMHPKEQPLRSTDLDALRNHHDLLCTLYWAAPAASRPPLQRLRDLVQPSTSHIETCAISIISWSRLVNFQLITNEALSSLEPFASWHESFISQVLSQHALAKTEVESASKGSSLSSSDLESTTARNQRPVEALLLTTLNVLRRAIASASRVEQASVLLSKTTLVNVLMFDQSNVRFNKVIIAGLEVLASYLELLHRAEGALQPNVQPNDDSQDYGDWEVFDELEEGVVSTSAPQVPSRLQHLSDVALEPIFRLLSNCFGADKVPEDSLLLKIVDLWTGITRAFVKGRLNSWDDFLGTYGSRSWQSLRNTEQKRKYTAYYFASLVEGDSSCYFDNRLQILNAWMVSLADRDAMLKYQHKFTAAVLDVDGAEKLLSNLPFVKDAQSGKYNVQLQDIRQGRLSLLSTLLSNLRIAYFSTSMHAMDNTSLRKDEYQELVLSLSNAMKANYLELGSSNDVQGAYVDFVHRVVEFLQQYTHDICPLDKFFTDSRSFPLPAKDPTYVVGRLRSYGMRLTDGGVPRSLQAYIQTVSERAAVDTQQNYLIGQLHEAMSGTYEHGNMERPTLRFFLVHYIFPSYIEAALKSSAGWLLVLPVLKATKLAYDDILLSIDTCDHACVTAIRAMTSSLYAAIRKAVELLINHSGLLEESSKVTVVTNFIRVTTATLQVVDYIKCATELGDDLVEHIAFFTAFCDFAVSTLRGERIGFSHGSILDADDGDDFKSEHFQTPLYLADIRKHARDGLSSTLSSNWTFRNGKYFFRRGQRSVEVPVDLPSDEEVKEDFCNAVEGFFDAVEFGEAFIGIGEVGLEDGGEEQNAI